MGPVAPSGNLYSQKVGVVKHHLNKMLTPAIHGGELIKDKKATPSRRRVRLGCPPETGGQGPRQMD